MPRVQGWSDDELERRANQLAELILRGWQAVAGAVAAIFVAKPIITVADAGVVVPQWHVQVEDEVIGFVENTYLQAARHVLKSLGSAVDPSLELVTGDPVEAHLTQARNRLRNVADDVWELIREQLILGNREGESVHQLAARVKHTAGVTDERALVIARTEIHAAHEAGSYVQSLYVDPAGKKEWLATKDTRTRETHLLANGQIVEIGQPFIVGGSPLRFPGDPLGPPGETIQCRCSVAYDLDVGVDDSPDIISPMSDQSDEAVVAAGGKWNPTSHPRGSDGKFIEKGAVANLLAGQDAPLAIGQAVGELTPEKWKNLTSAQQNFIEEKVDTLTTPQLLKGKLSKLKSVAVGKTGGKDYTRLFLKQEKKQIHTLVHAVNNMTQDEWNGLTPAQRAEFYDALDKIPPGSHTSKSLSVKLTELTKNLAKSKPKKAPTSELDATSTPAAVEAPTQTQITELKSTTKTVPAAVYKKHLDGTVIAISADGTRRYRWDEGKGKYEFQLGVNGVWKTTAWKTKKATYEDIKTGNWYAVTTVKSSPPVIPTQPTATSGVELTDTAVKLQKVMDQFQKGLLTQAELSEAIDEIDAGLQSKPTVTSEQLLATPGLTSNIYSASNMLPIDAVTEVSFGLTSEAWHKLSSDDQNLLKKLVQLSVIAKLPGALYAQKQINKLENNLVTKASVPSAAKLVETGPLPKQAWVNVPLGASGNLLSGQQADNVSQMMTALAQKPSGFDDDAEVQTGKNAFFAAMSSVMIDPSATGATPQWHGIRTYQSMIAEQWNTSLRTGKPLTGVSTQQAEWIKTAQPALDNLFNQSSLTHSVRVWRGLNDGDGSILASLKPGSVIEDKGYVSTTVDKGIATKFSGGGGNGIIFDIEVPKGSRALVPTQFTTRISEESEIVLPRNSRFEVISVDQPSGVGPVTVKMRAITDDPSALKTSTTAEIPPVPTNPTSVPKVPKQKSIAPEAPAEPAGPIETVNNAQAYHHVWNTSSPIESVDHQWKIDVSPGVSIFLAKKKPDGTWQVKGKPLGDFSQNLTPQQHLEQLLPSQQWIAVPKPANLSVATNLYNAKVLTLGIADATEWNNIPLEDKTFLKFKLSQGASGGDVTARQLLGKIDLWESQKQSPALTPSVAPTPNVINYEPEDEVDWDAVQYDAPPISNALIAVSTDGKMRVKYLPGSSQGNIGITQKQGDKWVLVDVLNTEALAAEDLSLYDAMTQNYSATWVKSNSPLGVSLLAEKSSVTPSDAPTKIATYVKVGSPGVAGISVYSDGSMTMTVTKAGPNQGTEVPVKNFSVDDLVSLGWVPDTEEHATLLELNGGYAGGNGEPLAGWSFYDAITNWPEVLQKNVADESIVALHTNGKLKLIKNDKLFDIAGWNGTSWDLLASLSGSQLSEKMWSFLGTWVAPKPGYELPLGVQPHHHPELPEQVQPQAQMSSPQLQAIPTPQAKQMKQSLSQVKVGYWSKPEKIWDEIQGILNFHEAADGEPYTILQVLKALDSQTKTKDPSPFETKITKWLTTSGGQKYVNGKTLGGGVSVGASDDSSASISVTSPSNLAGVTVTPGNSALMWKSIAENSPGTVLATGSMKLSSSPTKSEFRVVSNANGTATLQMLTNGKWVTTYDYYTQDELEMDFQNIPTNDKFIFTSAVTADPTPDVLLTSSQPTGLANYPTDSSNVNVLYTLKNNPPIGHEEIYTKLTDASIGQILAYGKSVYSSAKYRVIVTADPEAPSGKKLSIQFTSGSVKTGESESWFLTVNDIASASDLNAKQSGKSWYIDEWIDAQNAKIKTPKKTGAVPKPSLPLGKIAAEVMGQGNIETILAEKQLQLYEMFKKQPATYLASSPNDIYAALDGISSDTGYSVLQLLRVIDAQGALKSKEVNKHLFEKKIVDWLKSPQGYAVASGLPIPKPDTPKLNKGVSFSAIPSYAASQKYEYNVISPILTGNFWIDAVEAYGANWTQSQASALRAYTGGIYYSINSYLYGKTDTLDLSKQKITSQAQLGMRPSIRPVLLHRGVNFDGIGNADNYEDLQKMVGQTWKSDGFWSTSVGGSAAFSGKPVLIEVEAPPGTPMAWLNSGFQNGSLNYSHISQSPSENEMLLAAGLNYKIISVKKSGYHSVVRVRVVPPPTTGD